MAFFLFSFNGDDNLNISIFSVKSEGRRTIRFRMGHIIRQVSNIKFLDEDSGVR